ncbi:ESPR-type extended signal peptide-containing protein [Veillonella sp. T11011-6]|uniref:ESPR-type extended signal peptide-containing protein n=1 Tax=Veillonella sp. T11011-6 TaxID=2027459 RepID=UPI0011B0B730|nr:ESPR-type extended signal peptide-containing protein [Veillonella sp. T11011-6]
MNRIYNVIWSKTKKCYVVVSEIVKSGGGKVKSLHTGKTHARMGAVMTVAALLAGVNITSVNAAAIMINNVNNSGYATGQAGGNKWSYLYNYNNPGNMGALDGSATTGYYSGSALNGISIGHNTKIQEDSDPTYYSGVAIGDYAQATGGLSFSIGNYAQSTKPSAMALGTASLSSGFNSLAMMRQAAATGNFSTAIGTTSWASGTGSFAMGYSAQAKGNQSIAIGAAEPITVAGSGNEPSASYNGDTNTVTEGARSLAFGTKARTSAAASDSMAFGSNATTGGSNAVAVGNSANASARDAFAFGNTTQATGANAIAMGRKAQAVQTNSIAMGSHAKALEANALAIGGTAEASKAGTMAIGTAAKASSNNSTAIGNGAQVTGENSMALGAGAKISSNNSIALGAGTEFNDPLVNTYAAFTNEMNPAEAGVVAVGNTGTPRRIVNVAGGQNDNDAATIKQLRYVNNNLAMTIAGPTYTGYQANGSTYKAPDFSIKNSIYHTVKEAVEAAQTNFFSAKGTSADANYDNKGATGTNATAAGVRASAAGNYGTALGADATATSDKGTALGYKAKVTEDDGVALGSNSVANTAAGVAGYDVSAADNRANKYTALTGNVATSTLGAVSVGQSTSVGNETRQITNLAAGTKDTDAVNVAQLRNVNLKIAGNTNDNNGKNDVLLDSQTLTVKGDGAYVTTKANNQTIDVTLTNATKDKIDNAANKDLSNITNVGKKNITALGTIVEAGNNVTIAAPTVDSTTGQKTYTVNAMDTKVSLGTSGLMTLTGGTPDASGVRNYTVDVDPTKVAKTDLSNINNDGKTVIREEAQKAVKVIAGQNTTVTEGTDGTYKTYAVNVAAAGDYRLVENSAAADKAYTVTGNKVDLTVQDTSTPANTKTVTIKDIASKTELDTTKSDLTNKISDTKTELINKGLKFNADNNDVKTNKLGSIVTVAGDANITTKITQTGDDSTIAVTLNKDLNVNTVTATNTVKAGTATMGNQSATDNKAATQTGNFVTGLDNTSWNMADPVFVSGRAATEDQLKTVSDAVRAANAGSSDYRLIENDTATDKAYTVTSNKVDLKVKDDKSGTTKTVTIKDIASKTEFDKLNDRAVKYDVDGSGNVDKSKVTYEGPTYNSTNKSGGTHVTNVAYATGNDGSEAVNVDYLTDKIKDSSDALINKGLKFDANVGGAQTNKLGSTVTVQGEGAEADANYSGKNIKTFIKQDTAGNTTIDVKMNKNLEVETVTATGANGKDGKIGINGKDGVTTNLSITRDGKPGVDGAAGTTTTRIVYEKPDGTTEEVATLNDGLKFKGDMGATSNVKLNKQVDVNGGVTNAADLATGNNIGVTSAAVDADGNAKLQLQLAKDITGLKSVTATDTVKAGTATVGKQTGTDNKGGTQTGNFVTGLDNTNWNMADPVFVPGRAATEDQLKTVSDAVKAASASASDYRLIGDPTNTTDGSYKVTNNQVDLKVKDDKSGTTNTVTIKDIASKTELDKLDDRAVKYDLDPATNTVDKSKVTYEGPTYTNKTGGTHVTNVAYATGNDGSEAVNVDYLTDKIKDSSDALINKGLKFDANVGGVQTNKLGSTVIVKGEGNEADANYSGENIKTFIDQDNTTGTTTINVKLNKNLVADSIKVNKDGRDGKDGVSITGPTGAAGTDGNNGKVGITGADGKDAVSISGKDGVGHIGLTGPAGTNGKDGSNGIDMSVKNGYDDAAKGVKGEKGVDGVDGITRIVYTDKTGEHQVATMDDGMLYGGDTGTVIKKKLNNQVNVKGGITDPAKFTADDNIGVVSDGTDTLKVRLAKDLKGLNTVTATETVKAGDVVMGKQSDGTPAANTGNYVTGLDNKDWDVTNPTAVSGRAATEDQLKKVTEAINNQSSNSTDYRLVQNQTAGSNGDYSVDNNGDVALTVQDKNHPNQTETVTIKDVASKSNLDKLEDRAVKYDLDGTGNVDKSKVTYEGPTYTNKSGGTHVTNVAYATGNDGSEAVNVDYLTDKIKDSSDALINKGLKFDANVGGVQTNKLGSTVIVKGEGNEADANYSGENIKTFIDQDNTTGNTTINVKLNKNLVADSIKVNKDGRDGKDGVSITGPTGAAGTDGNNGKVGITGADGRDAVSISGKDGVGHIGLTGPAGTNGKDGSNGIDMTVKNGYDDAAKGVKGEKGVDGVDGITRIVYTDKTGEHQVATMDDGMLYGGDAGNVIKKKLNNQVNVKGGITDETKLTTDDNIGVVSDGTDTLKVRLAKDLKGLNTVTASETVKAGTATVGNQEATKADGTKETGNYVTGLDNKTWDADNIVTGRAATEDQLKDALANQSNAGLKFDANVGGTKTNKLGSTVIVRGEGNEADANYSGENIKTFIDQDNTTGTTTINVKLNKNLVADSIKVNKDGKDGKDGVSITGPTGVAGQDGNNGKVGITGADGKDAVSISGKDGVGHIGLTGPAGTNGKDGKNGIDISVKNGYDDAAKGVKGEKGVDGIDGITRIVYTDKTGEHQVATMDDGMLYGGDSGTVIKKKLNNQVNVKGGITDAAKLSNDDNIGVVADGTDTLMLRLAKDLKGLNSATFNNGTDGNTVVNGGGLTINDAAGNPLTSVTKDGVVITDGPSMTKDGIDASDKKINNVADGIIAAGSKDAVNGGQLHTAVEDLKTKGFGLTAEDGASVKKSLGDTVTVKGDGTNITTSVDNGAVKVALARDLNVDTVTANTVTTGDTKMDTNGVTIKDGANEATKLTKDGLQINDGGNKAVTIDKDGLTIENGPKVTKDGINAGDKKITNVEDGTIAAGSKDAVNGGQLHTAIEDIKAQGFGLKAEDGQSVKKHLGEVIDLKGDGNIKTSVDGTAIKMSLNDTITLGTDPAKQVKVDGSTGTITTGNGANQVTIDGSTGSVTAGNTVKAGDVIMGNQSSGGQNGNFVTGLDNKTWNPNNPVAVTGRAATEDQLKAVNDDFNEKAKNGRVFQGDQAGNDGKVVRGLGDTMNLKGGADVNRLSDNNLAVMKNAAGDGYDIKLAKDLNLKDGSTTYTKTVPGTNTTIPYTVDTKVDGGGITITPSINGQPVPGHTVSLTENGLNNGNNTITNVAPGINGTDAVNVNQLRNAMHSVDGKIADVGAASAAMAGLKPLQYDPLEPTQVLAAVGNYKGSTAAAIGIAHYTNESTMLHMGVSLGGHDNMVNAGVSYKFGTSDAKKAIPARYKAGPISSAYVMQDEVAALKAENLRMKQRDEELSAKYEQVQRDNEEMKAQIAMLMKQAGLTK